MTTAALDWLHAHGHTDAMISAASLRLEADAVVFPWFDDKAKQVYETRRYLRVNGSGKYKHTPGEKPPLYASPGAYESPRVVLVEGHRDALLAAQAGTPGFATGGLVAEKARPLVAQLCARKSLVVLVPDVDDAGARWRSELVGMLAGKAALLEVTLPEGFKDLGEVAELAVRTGTDPAEAVAEVLATAHMVDETGARPVEDFAAESAPEDFVSDFMVGGLWRKGTVLVVAGEEGDGKTTFVDQMLRQILRGERCFDHFEIGATRATRVLFVDTEMPDSDVAGQARRMAARGLVVPERSFHWYPIGGVRLDSSESDRLRVLTEIRRTDTDILWIDSGGNAVEDPKKDEHVKPFFNWLDSLLRAGEVLAVGITLHPRKRAQGGDFIRRFDDLFGSREWKGRPSQHLFLEAKRVTAVKDRAEMKYLWPARGGKKPHATIERPGLDDQFCAPFRIKFDPDAIDDIDLGEIRDKLVAIVRDNPGKFSMAKAIKEAHIRKELGRAIIKELLDAQVLVAVGVDKLGRGGKLHVSDDAQPTLDEIDEQADEGDDDEADD